VPPVVGGDFTRFGGDEGALCGTNFHDHVEEVGSGVSLDVKLDRQHLQEVCHVSGTDVTLVLSGVDRDALAPGLDAGAGGLDHVRFIAPPGIA